LLAFAITCFVIELTPGPNMAYLAVLSAGKGRRAGLAATLGVALGLLIVGFAAALGLAALITSSRMLYEALRWGGSLYLLWLAYEGWRGDDANPSVSATVETPTTKYFLRGLYTNLLNPKASVFYVAILPTFVDESGSVVGQATILTIVYVTIATLIHSTIVALAGFAQPWLEDESRNKIVKRVLSVALAGIAIWLFVATHQSSNLP